MWKIFSLLLVVGVVSIIACAMISDDSSAEVMSGTTGGCTWTLDGTKLTISGNGAIADYDFSKPSPWERSITEVVIENGVTSIGNGAFEGCRSLTSITIPSSVTSIGEGTFSGCLSLTSITIPNGVTSIGNGAFGGCRSLTSITIPSSVASIGDDAFRDCRSLTTITIPDSVTSIGEWAFSWCSSLTSITIPNSVTSIGNWAFEGCKSLTSITIPSSVTSIGDHAFAYCTSLTKIDVDSSNLNYCSYDNVLLTKDKAELIQCPGGKSGNYMVPSSVSKIHPQAFSYCTSLASITIPSSVTSIANGAFEGCSSLTTITIPNSVTSIGDVAFNQCESLTSITIPNSVTSIGWSAFSPFKFYESNGIDNIEPTAENLAGHTFISKSWKMVKQEGTSSSTTTYTVTFRANGNVIDTVSYENGATSITEPKIPIIKGYDARWPQYTLSGNMTVDAILIPKEYKVIYKVDGNVTFTESHKYDTNVTVRDTYSDGKNTYTPWTTTDVIVTNNTFTMIDSDIIFESTSSAVKYAYAVKYIDTNGNEISSQYKGEATYDSKITPDIPSIEGYVSPTEKITITVTKDPSKNVVTYVYTLMDIEISESDNTYVVKSGGIAIKYSKDVLSDIISKAESEPKVKMTITLGNSMITLDNESLRSLSASDVELMVKRIDNEGMSQSLKDIVKDNVAYDITFGDNTSFGNGNVSVSLRYDLMDGKDSKNLVIYHIVDGKVNEEISCSYEGGYVTFNTNHFSTFAVMYIEPDAEDSGSSMTYVIVGAIVAVIAIAAFAFVIKKH